MSATSRSVYRDTITVTRHPDGVLLPAAGAQVRFYEPNGSALTPLSVPLYGSADSTTPLVLPLLASAVGEVEVWSDEATGLRARQVVQYRDRPVSDEVVDFESPPGTYATRLYVDAAVGTHEAEANPHAQYLTQPEGDLLYLPLGTPIPDAYSKTESDARYEPFDSAYTKTESDGRYQGLSLLGQPNGYPPLDANGLLPSTYLPPLAVTDTFVATSEAQMLALTAQRGDLCVRVDVTETYVLAAEPASVLANWVELATTSVAGTATVLDQQEFAPAAAATTVTLAAVPTDVLEVTRNGVAQSLAAGHYTVAGAVVTFTDAFAAGERVAVLYAVGTSVITDAYTKGQSDLRYLQLAGGTMTGALTVNGPLALPLGHQVSAARFLVNTAGGGSSNYMIDQAPGHFGIGIENVDYFLEIDSAGNLISKHKAVALSPDAANTLEWRANGFYSAASGGGGLTQAQADLLYEPLDSAYTKVEADARYQAAGSYLTQATADIRYLQISNAFTQTLADARYPLKTDVDPYTVYYNQTRGDARYLQTANAFTQTLADARYPQLTGGSVMTGLLGPTTNNTRDLGTTALRWAKVWAVNAEFTNPPSYGGAAQPKITVNVSAPGSPATGDLWVW